MVHTYSPQRARQFIRLAGNYQSLLGAIGTRRVRAFWEVQDRVLTAVAADARIEIEAVGTPADYEAVLLMLTNICEETLRTDSELMADFAGVPDEHFEAALALMREQVPGFLETRLGQSLAAIYH